MKGGHEDEIPYPENPPWTMFFEGPLYQRYREYMAHKDFSQILLTSKLKLANQDSSIADLPDVHGAVECWSIDHDVLDKPDKQMANDTYNSVSEDFYRKFTRGKKEEKKRTRRTRAIIFIIILVLLGVALGAALIIHYFFVPPDADLIPAQVNISFSGNTSAFDITTEITRAEDTEDATQALLDDVLKEIREADNQFPDLGQGHPGVKEDILNPEGRIFDESSKVSLPSSTDPSTSATGKTNPPVLNNDSSTSVVQSETETFDPLDFFGIDEFDISSTQATNPSVSTGVLRETGITTKAMEESATVSATKTTSMAKDTEITTDMPIMQGTRTDLVTTTSETVSATLEAVLGSNTISTPGKQGLTRKESTTNVNDTDDATTTTDSFFDERTTEGEITTAAAPTQSVTTSKTLTSTQSPSPTTQEAVPSTAFPQSITQSAGKSTQSPLVTTQQIVTSTELPAAMMQEEITSTHVPQSSTKESITTTTLAPITTQESVTSTQLPPERTQENATSTELPPATTQAVTSTPLPPDTTTASAIADSTSAAGTTSVLASTELPVTTAINTSTVPQNASTAVVEKSATTTEASYETTTSSGMFMTGSITYKSETARISCTILDIGQFLSVSIREVKNSWSSIVSLDNKLRTEWGVGKLPRHDVEVRPGNETGASRSVTLTLLVSDIECRDGTGYQCVLEKSSGTTTETAKLVVVGRPDSKVDLQIGPSIIENNAVRLTAIWQGGYPIPWANMSWTALDKDNNTYNLAEYGDYRDYELEVNDVECSTYLKSSIVIFPKIHLNDTRVFVEPDLSTARPFVNDEMLGYLKSVEFGVQKILVIPKNYCPAGATDLTIPHPYTPCTKYVWCIPGNLVVQHCPTGTCFNEQGQECF